MVLHGAVDHPLETEPEPFEHPPRPLVMRIAGRRDHLQPELRESVADDHPRRFGHQPPAPARLVEPITEHRHAGAFALRVGQQPDRPDEPPRPAVRHGPRRRPAEEDLLQHPARLPGGRVRLPARIVPQKRIPTAGVQRPGVAFGEGAQQQPPRAQGGSLPPHFILTRLHHDTNYKGKDRLGKQKTACISASR